MKQIIKLTEKDLTRIVKRVITEEEIDDNESQNIYRKLVHYGDTMDEEIRRIKNIREELDSAVRVHHRRGSMSDIFDNNKRTPSDISDLVRQLTSKMTQLESTVNQYKKMIKNSISE